MKKKVKELLWAAVFLLTAAILLQTVSTAFRPLRTDYGAMWKPYLSQEKNSLDYLYLGSSYAYCDVDPQAVYDETGLNGFVMAGPEQTLSQTYWYLKEALRTQKPRLVILEGTALQFNEYQNYTQINVGYMPQGINRLGAIFTASEPELRLGLCFDLYFYHGRWPELTRQEMKEALLYDGSDDTLKGFMPMEGACGQTDGDIHYRTPREEEVYQDNLEDLDRIVRLCEKEGIQLVVVFHPTYSRFPVETYDKMCSDVERLSGDVLVWDLSQDALEIGLTLELHYYDAGHLNHLGAEAFSRWLGNYMVKETGMCGRETNM